MEATSIDKLVAHCQKAKFTGILRMRAKEGIGEVWFLSGVADEMHFGTSEGDEALERMRKATDATYELAQRLPHPGGGFKKKFPAKGSVATATPVTLMRYCERYALTCTLAVESKHVLVEAEYDMGELTSVETTADDDGITSMLEATEGTYEFKLPRAELPPGTPVLPPASPSIMESIPPPEVVGVRALLEIKPVTGKPTSDEAEVKRKTVEMARQKKAATPARPVPRPASASKPDKQEAKPVAIVEAKPPEPAKPAPEPAKPEPVVAKEEPKETKPAEPAPAVFEEKRVDEEPAATKEEEEEEEEEREEEEEPSEPKAPPPAKQSQAWLVFPILFAIALVYLLWTNRM